MQINKMHKIFFFRVKRFLSFWNMVYDHNTVFIVNNIIIYLKSFKKRVTTSDYTAKKESIYFSCLMYKTLHIKASFDY